MPLFSSAKTAPFSTEITLGDMDVYVVHPSAKKKGGIIVNYDIFGFDAKGTREFCDQLAQETGYTVILGDYFRGNAWPLTNYPPNDIASFMMWEISFSEEQLMNDMTRLSTYLKERCGCNRVGLLGFGYGGKVAVCGSKTGHFQAAAVMHGDFVHESDAPHIDCPLLMVDAGEDADHCHIAQILKAHPKYGAKSEFVRYNEMHHGCINRGDKNDPEVKQGMDKAFSKAKTFFQNCLE